MYLPLLPLSGSLLSGKIFDLLKAAKLQWKQAIGKSSTSTHRPLSWPWQGRDYLPGQTESIVLTRWDRSLELLQRTGGSCGSIRHPKKTWRTGVGAYGLGKGWAHSMEREWVSLLTIALLYWLRGYGGFGQRGRDWRKPWSCKSLVVILLFPQRRLVQQ